MARVYRAQQEKLERDVAIKVLPPYYAADPAFVERFKLEARAMAELSHPNIVTIHDAGEELAASSSSWSTFPAATSRSA